MAVDLEKLVVQLSADIKSYDRELARANGLTNNRMRAVERRHQAAVKKISQIWSTAGNGIGKVAGVLGFGIGINEAKRLIDASTGIRNALRVTGLEGEKLTAVYDQLFASAQRNATPIESLVQLYSRLSVSASELGVNQEQLTRFTDGVAVALRVGGTSSQEASGALLQLSQAMGGGIVRAEEFTSLLEGAPTILQAAARGILEAEGSVAKLRQIMLDGELSSRAFFDGIAIGSREMESKLSGTESTISQRLVRLGNVLIDVAGEFNKSAKAGEVFGGAIDRMADNLSTINFDALISEIQRVVTAFTDGYNAGKSFFDQAGAATGADRFGEFLTGGGAQKSYLGGALTVTSTRVVQRRVEDAFNQGVQNNGGLTPELIRERAARRDTVSPKSGRLPPAPVEEKISINDPKYRATDSGKSKPKGSGGAKATSDSRFDADIQSIRDRTAALIEEQKIVGLSYQEQERRRMALDLEQTALADLREEARRKGETDLESIKLSDEQRAKIEAASAAYAEQADILRRLQEQQQLNEEMASEFYETFKEGAISAITGAESLSEALANVAKRLGDLFLNAAFDSLFKPPSGGSGGGVFGGLFSGLGGLFQRREMGGPVRKGQPYIVGEKRPEIFVPGQSGTIIPRVPMSAPSMPNLAGMRAGGAGAVSVQFAPVYNVQGNTEDIQQLRQQMARDRADFESRTISAVRSANARGVKMGRIR